MTRPADLLQGTLDLLILKTLSWGPAHGYAVARWIEQLTGEVLHIGEGSLYPALHRLEERDWVGSSWQLSSTNRRTKAEFGDARAVREQTVEIDQRMMRRGRRADWLADVLRDGRVGLRSLRRTPAFAVTAVLCAALGIGVTAAIMSATYAILIRPLPYADADRLR